MSDESSDKTTSNSVTMGQAFKSFWMNYVNFTGKSSRSEYWWWYLWDIIIRLIIAVPVYSTIPNLFSAMDNVDMDGMGTVLGSLLASASILIIYSLARLIPQLAILVRRLRDVGLPDGATIALVIAKYVLPVFGFFVSGGFWVLGFLLNIAIIVIAILPTDYKDQRRN